MNRNTFHFRELDSVQQHDREVTKQAAETQNELDEALKESEKNASLLAEYHELYELQRKRLEFQICMFIFYFRHLQLSIRFFRIFPIFF